MCQKTLDSFTEKEIKRVIKTLLGFNRILVGDWDEKSYDLAVLSDPLIHILVQADHRLSQGNFIQVAKKVFEIAVNLWQEYGFYERTQALQEKYKGELENLTRE